MDYDGQVSVIADYLRSGEKERKDFTMGFELEHFVVEKDGTSVSYYGDRGVGEILKKIESKGFEGIYEGKNILGIKHPDFTITLEPGSQLEFSASTSKKISEIENKYNNFTKLVSEPLEEFGYKLVNAGYLPKSKIDDIKIIPKKRYDLMYEYFNKTGKYVHNMMKGTAALQVAIDYKSEKDFEKKFYVANCLTPIIYAMFDNADVFEGKPYEKYSIRSLIWANTDPARCGIVEGSMSNSFCYEDYAEYILNAPPILMIDDGEYIFTGDKLAREVFNKDNSSDEEIDYLLSMFFPDVRARKYLEIRAADSVQIEYALGLAAMIKGLFYSKENLNDLYDFFRNINEFQIEETMKDIVEEGIQADYAKLEISELFDRMITDAGYGLEEDEAEYLKSLESLMRSKI